MTLITNGTFEEIRSFNENYFRVVLPNGSVTWVLVTPLPVKYAEMLEEKYNSNNKQSVCQHLPLN